MLKYSYWIHKIHTYYYINFSLIWFVFCLFQFEFHAVPVPLVCDPCWYWYYYQFTIIKCARIWGNRHQNDLFYCQCGQFLLLDQQYCWLIEKCNKFNTHFLLHCWPSCIVYTLIGPKSGFKTAINSPYNQFSLLPLCVTLTLLFIRINFLPPYIINKLNCLHNAAKCKNRKCITINTSD